MEGNSFDSTSSRSGGASSFSLRLSAQRSISVAGGDPAASAGGIGGLTRGRSVVETSSVSAQAKVEPGDILEGSARDAYALVDFSAPAAPLGDRTLSPLRRGPGRPRKDGGASPRGKTPGTRMRGGSRGRIKSQFSGRQLPLTAPQQGRSQQNPFASNASPSGGSSSSPIAGGSYYGVDLGPSAFEDEAGQLSDPAMATNREQRCAFCYLTAASRLGQGDLIRHDPTPGFNLSALTRKSTLRDQSPSGGLESASFSGQDSTAASESATGATPTEQLTLRINLKHSKVVRPKTARKKADIFKLENELVEEIDRIGLPDDIELTDLFEATGHCWAHHCCASWSDGVVQSESLALLHVDNAAAAAMTQKCAGCGRTGASISCRADGCRKKFHYPCASAYGGFQDIKTLAFLCPDHLDEVTSLPDTDATCAKCETVGDISTQLFCTSCGDHYHASCLEPAVATSVTVRAGWQCPDCKMCQHCQRYGDDSRMLVCDSCDKGYHVYCMQPPMTTIPKSGWKCKNCRICTDCGSRTPGNGASSRWHLNYTVCDSCYQQRNKGLFCPLCERAYRHMKSKSMRQCSSCKKHVHLECIRKSLTSSSSESALSALSSTTADYVCPICQGGEVAGAARLLSPSHSQPALSQFQQQQYGAGSSGFPDPSMTPSSSASMDENEEAETEMLAIFIKNEMAGGDSLSGTESPFPELDVTLGDMDVDGVMQLLEPEESNEFGADFPFSNMALEGKKTRGGGAPAGLKKQAGLPRTRLSTSGRASSRAKSSSCSSSATGSIRGGNAAGEKRRIGRGGGASGRGAGGQRGAMIALQSTLQNLISNHHNGGGVRKKDDDEYIHTVVVSANDEFVFCQDICVICGSFGKGPEGRFIACMQCGQCYHPYCANINVNSAIMRRGWRCLDCTVCEGCGRGDDEQHLLLCDDCDVSFHTYCLDPPLETIPAGPWVCKWCSSCQVCGDALLPSDMAASSVKVCPRCESMVACPLCRLKYMEGDLVIQCEACDRWCHCKCNGLANEDAIDKAADKGFKCWYCRPNGAGGLHGAADGRGTTGYGKAVDSSFHVVMDGMSLTKSGLRTVQWRPRRRPIHHQTSTASIASMNALDDVIDSVHAYVTRGLEDHAPAADDPSMEERMDAGEIERLNVEVGGAGDNGASADPNLFSPMDKKKFRQKKYFRVGVGGFLVRQTRQRTTTDKLDETQEMQELAVEGVTIEDGRESAAGDAPAATVIGKPKKRKRQMRKLAKLQLEDNYPSYIQEAFFGASAPDARMSVDDPSVAKARLDDQDSPVIQGRPVADNELEKLTSPPIVKSTDKHHRRGEASHHQEQQASNRGLHQAIGMVAAPQQTHSSGSRRSSAGAQQQDPIGEGFEDIGEGDDIFPPQMDIHQHEFSNLIDMLMGEGDMDPVGNEDGEQRQSPNLENLIDSREYVGIGEVDTAEMDRLMGNMLDDELRGACDSDNSNRHQSVAPHHQQQQPQPPSQPMQQQHMPPTHGHAPMVQNQSMLMQPGFHQQQAMQQQQQPQYGHEQGQRMMVQQHTGDHISPHHGYGAGMGSMVQHPMHQQHEVPDYGQDPSRFLSAPPQPCSQPQTAPSTPIQAINPEPPLGSHLAGGSGGAASYQGSVSPKADSASTTDAKSYLERWEPDESLGDRATIAAVLYANLNYPDLRLKYPTWTERAKQIAKLWRLLVPESRQAYVQRARDNRAASRQLIKAKKNTEPVSRQSSQTPQVPESPDPSMERPGYPFSAAPSAHHMQDYKPPHGQPMDIGMETAQSPRMAPSNPYGGGGGMTPYGSAPPGTLQHQTSRMEEFKVPQTPTGSGSFRPEALKRSDSQPHTPKVPIEEHIKTEPYTVGQQQPSYGSAEQGTSGISHQQPYGNYGSTVAYQGQPASMEQQYGSQPTDWSRCQPSLLDDFIEIERRDQRSRQPSFSSQPDQQPGGFVPQSPMSASAPQWPDMTGQQAGQLMMQQAFPRPPVPQLQHQRSIGMADSAAEVAGAVPSLPRDRQHEEWLSRTQHDIDIRMKAVEGELNQLRKNKKNIASKQRQLKKNNMELPAEDSNYLARLVQDISERQKELENLRKQAKQHNNLVQEYNVKHGLAAPTSAPGSVPTTPTLHHPHGAVNAPGTPMLSPVAASHSRSSCGSDVFDTSQHFTRPPMTPTTPVHPSAHFGDPASVQMRMSHGEPNPFGDGFGRPGQPGQMINVLQHPYGPGYRPGMPYGSQHPPPISAVNTAFPASTTMALAPSLGTSPQAQGGPEPKKKKKYYKKKSETAGKGSDGQTTGRKDAGCKTLQETGRSSPPCPPSNLLAMAPEFDVDVVITVSTLLDRTVAELDGPSSAAAAERENVLLKRLLDNSPPAGTSGEEGKKAKHGPGKRAGSIGSAQGSPKKRQRRMGVGAGGAATGSKAKAAMGSSQSAADAHTAFLEQLTAHLKNLPPLAIQEPAPKSDPLISNVFGVTQLVQRTEKPLMIGDGPGRMRLSFMHDYYLEVFDKTDKQQEQQLQQRQLLNPQQFMAPAAPSSAPPNAYGAGNRYLATLQQQQPQMQAPYQIRHPSSVGDRQLAIANSQQMAATAYGGPAPPPFGFKPGEYPTMESDLRSLTESPLEVICSDAPEFDEELLPTYPALKPVMPAEGRLSPNFRLVAPVPMRAVPADPPSFYEQAIPSLSTGGRPGAPREDESDMVSVTLTLDMEAAHRVHDVLRGLAALLQIEVPKQFEVHIDTPPHTPEKVTGKESMELMQQQQQVAICRNCESAVQQAAVRKKLAELGLTPKEDDADEVVFCSQRCYDQFAIGLKAPSALVKPTETKAPASELSEEKYKPTTTETAMVVAQSGERIPTTPIQEGAEPSPSTTRKPSGAGVSDENRLDEIIKSVLGDTQVMPIYSSKEEIIHVKDLPRFRDSTNGEEGGKFQVYEKRWKDTKWRSWTASIGDNVLLIVGQSLESMYMEIAKSLFRPTTLPDDVRVCDFCTTVGDGPTETCGRLLNLDAGRWVHVNCALWSAEVYERVEGALVNVEKAVRRAISNVCSHCQRYGASVPCYKLRCDRNYHLPCAVETGCTFFADKTMFCQVHSTATTGEVTIMNNLAVIRRVYIERDENRIIAKLYQQGDSGELALRVGSLIFGHIGQLLPHQLRNFHCKDFIYPVGYSASRIYWSSKDVHKRNMYMCSISDREGQPEFNVSFNEEGFAEMTYSKSSASDAWSGILQPLEQLRVDAGMLKLFSTYLAGEVLFGLTESSIVKMIESLPGVDMMPRYECKYGRSPLIDLPLAVNPSGCARCEPRFRTYIKRPHAHTASTSGSLQNLLALSGLSAEMAFYHYGGSNRQTLVSKWSQYRKMKQEWQNNVYLARSKIQGLGLYAKRDIEMNAMVIEYIGEVIRNEVAERREKLYQAHNRGIYMFRIDEERVIDATVSGGLARYINHSCDPNCVAELFEFDREAKIIIMSCRPISKGEELTYDYQFDVEDDSSKIPCLCGAPNCQKWMN